jgi:hypothetical protein
MNMFPRRVPQRFAAVLAASVAFLIGAAVSAKPQPAAAAPACVATGNESIGADKRHYIPDTTVSLSGRGFSPSCDVSVDVVAPDDTVATAVVTTDAGGILRHVYLLGGLTGDYRAEVYGSADVLLSDAAFTNGPVITLDKGDYRSGETVHVTGEGYTPFEPLIVQVTRPDGSIVTGDGTNTQGRDTVAADAAGRFAYDYIIRNGFVADYVVEVLGASGAPLARTSFTDSGFFVQNLGTIATDLSSPSDSASLTVTGTVTAGNSIIVAASTGIGGGEISCEDSKGNTYTSDVGQTSSNGSVGICSTHGIAPSKVLVAGVDTITVSFPVAHKRMSISANEFSGLAATGTLDQTAARASSGTALTSNLTATTSQADEVLFAAFFFFNGSDGAVFTAGSGSCTGTPTGTYTLTNPVIGSGASSDRPLATEYRVATATGAYAACGTMDVGEPYAAVIATYKVAPQGQITIVKNTTGGDGTFSFTASGAGSATPSVSTSGGTGSTTISVSPGTYSLSETVPSGWAQTGAVCDTGTPESFTVAAGATVTCTFTNNTGLGQIRIDKTAVGGDGTFNFTITGPSGSAPSITTSGGAGTTGLITVTAGTYSVSESSLPPGWVASSASCSSGTPGSFTVPVGGTVTCSFTNTAQGKIRINKTTVGDNGTFGFTIAGPSDSTHTIRTTGAGEDGDTGEGTTGPITVTAGTYSVSESSLPPGWVASSASCSSGTPGSFTVPIGGTVTCSFTNTAQGKIRINKTAVGGDGTFGFTIAGPSGSTPTITTSGGAGTTGLITVTAGHYSVSESSLPPGWVLSDSFCNPGHPGSFPVRAGDTVTCSFTNTAQGKIQISKTAMGGDGTFGFTIAGPSGSTPTITTSGGRGATGLITVTAGTYSVSESSLPPGWVPSDSFCTFGPPDSVTVPVGGTIVCSFTNTAQGKIQINKTTVGGNGTFGFTIAGPSGSTPTITTSGGAGTTGLVTVTAGTYSVSESSLPPGWAPSSANCSSGTPGSFTVPAGATVTCSFTNTAQGKIQINKIAVGGNGAFGFTIAGPSGSTPAITTTAGAGTTGLITVTAGTYSVSESSLPPGWVPSSASCSTGTPASFTVPIGGTVTCSFTNTAQGRIQINKTAVGGNGTFGFTIAGPSGSTPTITTTGGAGTTGPITVTAGTYSVSESSLPPGWVPSSASCSSGTPGSFTVPAGATVTCSFTNTAQGKIQINKTAVGGNGTFGFTIAGPSGSTPAITTTAGAGTTGLITVTAGTYSVSESSLPAAWALSAASCSAGTPASFTVPAGGTVTCSFTNTNRVLGALGPAAIWLGIKNSDDNGLYVDLLAEVLLDTTVVGQGQINNVASGGSAAFSSALLTSIPLTLNGSPAVPSGSALKLRLSVRRTCAGNGHNSGSPRLWYSGQPVDTGNAHDAGTRVSATVGGSSASYFPLASGALSTTAGTARVYTDVYVTNATPCPSRPFSPFGTWSITMP